MDTESDFGGKQGHVERLYTERVDCVSDWIWETDSEGVYTYSNRVVEDLLGYTVAEMVGRSVYDVLTTESADAHCEAFAIGKDFRKSVNNVVCDVTTKDGRMLEFSSSFVPIYDADGEVSGFRGISRDVTEDLRLHRMAEEVLEKYKAVVDNSPTGIFIVQNGKVVFGNATIARIMGYDLDEISGLDIWEVVHPHDREWLQDYYVRRIRGEDVPTHYIARGLSKAGDVRYFEFRAALIDHAGAPAVLLNAVDITDRMITEQDLKKRTSELEAIVKAFPDLYFWLDENRKIVSYHAITASDLHAPPEEFLGKTFDAVLPPELAKQFDDAISKCLETKSIVAIDYTLELLTGDRVFEARVVPLTDEHVIVIVREISERKRAELALRLSEDRYRNLVEHISDWVWEINSADVFTYVSTRAQDLLGYTAEEMIGKTPFDFMAADEAERVRSIFTPLAMQHAAVNMLENTMLHKDGSSVTVETNATPVFESSGNFAGYRGIARDISERKASEDALRRSEERFRAIFDAAAMGTAVVGADGRIIQANPAFHDMMGYEIDELRDKHFIEITHPDDIEADVRRYEEVLSGSKHSYQSEKRYIRKDGQAFWARLTVSVVRDPSGQVSFGVALVEDISERKRALQALRDSEKRLMELINFLPDATFVVDRDGKVIVWNRATEELTGVKAAEMVGKSNFEYSIPFYGEKRPMLIDLVMHPESHWEGLYEHIDRMDETIISDAFTPALGESGAYIWGKASPLYDADGNLTGAVESVRDITSIKMAEQALKSRNRELLLLSRISDIMRENQPEETTYHQIVEEISATIDLPVVAVELYDVERAVMVFVGAKGIPGVGITSSFEVPVDQTLSGVVVKTGQTVVEEHALDRPEYAFNALRKLGIRAFVSVPMFLGGKISGALSAGSPEHVPIDQNTVSLLQSAANYIAILFERRKSEENRRAYEKQMLAQQRQFYRDTIMSVTGGKLSICDTTEVRPYITSAMLTMDVSSVADVSSARHAAQQFCRDHGLEEDRLFSFMIGVGEAITNSIKHSPRGRVYAGLENGSVWIGISDKGSGIESLILPQATLMRGFSTKPSMGLGYSIMLEVADRILLKTDNHGTTVILVKKLEEPVIEFSTDQLPDTWHTIPDL